MDGVGLRWISIFGVSPIKLVNHIMPSVHKMVKHTLKNLQYLFQDFQRMFNNFRH